MKELNFNDGRPGFRMYGRVSTHNKKRNIDYNHTEHLRKGKKEFKISQPELEQSPGYIKPVRVEYKD